MRVFSDSFSGRAGSPVSTRVWKYDTGPGSSFGTGEIETMTNSTKNVFLNGRGDLVIRAIDTNGAWTSGRIQTRRLFGAPAGGEMLVTASIKQPDPANGLGYWPAFWMLGPGTWPATGEIDILEDVNALSSASHTFHCGVYPGGPCNEPNGIGSGLLPCPSCQVRFVRYSVLVDRQPGNQNIRWFVNGHEVFAVTQYQVPRATWHAAVDHAFTIIFDLAMGGGYPDGVCGCSAPSAQTTSGGAMVVRYLRVFERPARA